MHNKSYKMKVDFCSDCIQKLDPLFLKVAETYAMKGEGKCTIIFQVHESGVVKALFLPLKESKMVSNVLHPLWDKAKDIED